MVYKRLDDTVREEEKQLKEDQKELKQSQAAAAKIPQKQKHLFEIQRERAKIREERDQIEAQHGSSLEIESNTRELGLKEKIFKKSMKKKKSALALAQNQAQNVEKAQKKFDKIAARLAEKQSKRNAVEEGINQTKTLDDLKERDSELQRLNEEDQEIIQDENASDSEKEAARDRVTARNEELNRLQPQIEARERTLGWQERVKEVFKKYGVTVASVLIAAGITIGAVIGTITNALKATSKALGKGLKDIGSKLGSILPG